jgi:acetylornithine deacetylase/succinyl-diaminopimelate desuccinylase-like protein
VPAPSAGIDEPAWQQAHDGLVGMLRELIRIPSVNPPDEPTGDGELRAAQYVAGVLEDCGLRPDVVEPFPGRGSVCARLRGDGTGGEPLLLLSHLDVVPAPADAWTHDPFAADVADGYVWGRGAVDMKGTAAMQLAVIRLLAAEARAAGRDPASDAVPGLRRDVLFAGTADEEAGGHAGIGWIVDQRPEWLRAAGALTEAGGVSVDLAGRRLYPIQVAEKGFAVYRVMVHGTAGHGSMPSPDNAVVLAADVVRRLAEPGPVRATPVMARFLDAVAAAVDPQQARVLRALAGADARGADLALDGLCDPMYARGLRALLRDTISPNMISAGTKYNVIPGEAELIVDCRVLPETDEPEIRAEIERRLGPLVERCDIDLVIYGPPAEAPIGTPLYDLLESTLREHDPDGVPVPGMPPFATDAKHLARLGVPTYGFSPLRLEPDERFLERFHGVDERVGLDALRWGLPVLYDVVRRYCG